MLKVEELKRLLRERSYFVRIYITRGKNIGGEGSSLDSYIIIKLGDKVVNLKGNLIFLFLIKMKVNKMRGLASYLDLIFNKCPEI